MAVLSTYRLQLSGDGMTFADAEALLDYLDDLGVSHLYLSPILTAVHGSTHGYDVTDPTSISVALGGAEGFSSLARAARARGMGLVVDIVPNHVGVDRPEQNPWWWDVLTHGRRSEFAAHFDIDWPLDPDGRMVLPVLGSDADLDALTVDGDVLRLGDRVWPVRPGSGGGSAAEVHARQHYRLTGWRDSPSGYRRFITINSLAAVRPEDPDVFEAAHVEVGRWLREGLVDGLRLDHVDGLSNPPAYLDRLRQLAGPEAWIVAEKVLEPGESLDPNLPIAGTTGYDGLREIGGLFVDPTGEATLTALSGSAPQAVALKRAAVRHALSTEVNRLRRAIVTAIGTDAPELPEAIAELVSRIGVYRTDYRGVGRILAEAITDTVHAAPHLAPAVQLIVAALDHPEPATRFQQLSAAATAIAVEGNEFYRNTRLVSLNEIGSTPTRFTVTAEEFHERAALRARHWPVAMITLSTHDTKRSEDVRARISVLSQLADEWSIRVARWNYICLPPDPVTGLFLWQNIFGVWPASGEVGDELRSRLHSYARKAAREAALHTNWTHPDTQFEDELANWIDAVLDGPIAVEITALVRAVDDASRSDALAQKLLSLTVPGVPDIYQGTEVWDDSLVDPDNRRPVDFPRLRAELNDLSHPKTRVVAAGLRSRRERPQTYLSGGYTPLFATGAAPDHIIGFLRGDDVLVAVRRWTLRQPAWHDTYLTLPDGDWTDRLTGRVLRGAVSAAELFAELPGVLLER
ncbi:(1-_4)-alpha-D-glucan 1-alpha-D-glucosylmutase [Mycobacterium sp. MAA66]|uniref:malto-oligosyltrehalose synthase n=1 Tax=Mycobacterium sp. MAA66 TaxID=3156297 RepID=UPI003510E7E0